MSAHASHRDPRQASRRTLLRVTLLLALVIAKGTHGGAPDAAFKEGNLLTFVSGGMLLWIARTAAAIGRVRHLAPARTFWAPATAVWGILAASFVFLAADEMLAIHENLDKLFHLASGLRETGLSDRLDDAIVVAYGLALLALLFAHRVELLRWPSALRWIATGFALAAAMVLLDALTNRSDALEALMEQSAAKQVEIWLSVAEDSLKIYAVACLLLGFDEALRRARAERRAPG